MGFIKLFLTSRGLEIAADQSLKCKKMYPKTIQNRKILPAIVHKTKAMKVKLVLKKRQKR